MTGKCLAAFLRQKVRPVDIEKTICFALERRAQISQLNLVRFIVGLEPKHILIVTPEWLCIQRGLKRIGARRHRDWTRGCQTAITLKRAEPKQQ